jgi:hypothetical protein
MSETQERMVQMGARLPREVRDELETWARQERRHVSNLVRNILEDAVRRRRASGEEREPAGAE